jgi:hypothetical protein
MSFAVPDRTSYVSTFQGCRNHWIEIARNTTSEIMRGNKSATDKYTAPRGIGAAADISGVNGRKSPLAVAGC